MLADRIYSIKFDKKNAYRKKCLLIRKKLGLMSVVLDEIEFRFLKLLGGFLLIFVVFDDMGYDKE